VQGEDQTVSAPAGVTVSNTEDEGLVVFFPAAGAFPLSLSWTQSEGGTTCRGTGQVTLQVLAATQTLATFKKTFDFGRTWDGTLEQKFLRPRGGDATPVRVVVRASGRGTLRPPSGGRPLLDKTVSMGSPLPLESELEMRRRNLVLEAFLFRQGAGYVVSLSTRFPGHDRYHPFLLRFAFTVELFQSGRRISAISTGMRCRTLSSGGHLARGCVTVGFRKRT
jgi:hypothetical protein